MMILYHCLLILQRLCSTIGVFQIMQEGAIPTKELCAQYTQAFIKRVVVPVCIAINKEHGVSIGNFLQMTMCNSKGEIFGCTIKYMASTG